MVQTAPPYDARVVSNFVLVLAGRTNQQVSQMALLKILYFAQGWYLATYNRQLFSQPVEAWEYGPVVKVVRDAFKEFGKRPITNLAEKLDLETGELVELPFRLEKNDEDFVKAIFDTYIKYDALTLSDMTHEKGSPWDKVWNSQEAIGRLGLRIRNDEIRAYFLNISQTLISH